MSANTKLAASSEQNTGAMRGTPRLKSLPLDVAVHRAGQKRAASEIPSKMVANMHRIASRNEPARIPFINPAPPRLSLMSEELTAIERSGIFSNYGPVNSKFERQILDVMFDARGSCVTVANATLGLILAIRDAVGLRPRARYALMPSFTFAAAAQAALWCGLTPLFCDVDRDTWLPDANAEQALLEQYGDDIAVLVPNATFGNCLDLARYDRLSGVHGIPLVIDGAAALGSLNIAGEAFGLDSRHPVVFSMHATKSFATGEGGLIYCADQERIARLRCMGGFGLNEDRVAVMPGLNTKLSEVAALLALTKLQEIAAVSDHRFNLRKLYCSLLSDFTVQRITGQRSAVQFFSVLVPLDSAPRVPDIINELTRLGIGCGRYFSTHLANHPFFRENSVAGDLSVSDEISRRVVALPISDTLAMEDVIRICDAFKHACRTAQPTRAAEGTRRHAASGVS